MARIADSQRFVKYMSGKGNKAKVVKYGKCACGMGMLGAGKLSKKALADKIIMHGGSWGSFTNWVKGAANTVANGVKKGANAVYNGAIKPGVNLKINH
jgi:hypothetical protein